MDLTWVVWLVLATVWSAALVNGWRTRRRRRRVARFVRNHCGHCGYKLTGNQSGRCPECGKPIGVAVAGRAGNRVFRGRIAEHGSDPNDTD